MLKSPFDKVGSMDSAVKLSLLETVNDCVKELQLKCTSERSNVLNNDEATNSFLWVLEAIFIHGLNNSFLKTSISTPFASILSSFSSSRNSLHHHDPSTTSQVPNPSFWEFVLVFLHRDIIEQINALHLIHTDVGRCRAWLRIALNEGLLVSFVENMTLKSNRRCLKAFYRSSAFLRDTEKCDILKNYLLGIELLDFRLVINNSFLNHWNSGPLSLVGLWVDENSSVHEQGVDIAKNLEAKDFQAIPKLQQQQINSSRTPPRFQSEVDNLMGKQQPPLLSQDDALRIILGSSGSARPPQASTSRLQPPKSTISCTNNVNVRIMKKSPPPPTIPEAKSPHSKSDTDSSETYEATEQTMTRAETTVISSTSPSPQSTSMQNGTFNENETEQVQMLINTTTCTTETQEEAKEKLPQHDQIKEADVYSPNVIIDTQELMVLSSSPAMDNQQNLLPQQPISPIKAVDSPVDENQSYASLLLTYKQRNQPQKVENNSHMSYGNSDDADTAIDMSFHENSTSLKSFPVTGSASTAGSKKSMLVRVKSRLSILDDSLSLIRTPRSTSVLIMELRPRISQYTKILANEVGLDMQNYACKMCNTSIGMIYGAAHLCHFTGALYCSSCHVNQEKVIPSRILLNWDFTLYAVCQQAFDFLEEIKDSAIFDVEEINPFLYKEVEEFAQVNALRTKLFYIGKYLKTCKNTKPLEELKEAGARKKEHFLDSEHLYSLTDLLGVPNKSLHTLLTKLVSTGSGHILTCKICREKGFICEVCKNAEVIFPFQFDNIFKCPDCGAVYHDSCMNFEKVCPRCERWKKNETSSSALYDEEECSS